MTVLQKLNVLGKATLYSDRLFYGNITGKRRGGTGTCTHTVTAAAN
ncbi:hypothetical protein HMPREF3033_00765 [Veillonellaceae bacterium DNF00751]|nr:hypothetical protein HMPREF3033_00765 [Veillonellaceae bacterium DNF00751]